MENNGNLLILGRNVDFSDWGLLAVETTTVMKFSEQQVIPYSGRCGSKWFSSPCIYVVAAIVVRIPDVV